jgi:hypothetical protein
MADYTITDLPRELTDEEAARMTSVASDLFRQFEFEQAQPSHLCKKPHGGKLVETPDWNVEREQFPQWPAEIDGERAVLDGIPQSSRTHQHEPRCHDCGRLLNRPPGAPDELTWLCPNARRVLPPGGLDTAIECGEKR